MLLGLGLLGLLVRAALADTTTTTSATLSVPSTDIHDYLGKVSGVSSEDITKTTITLRAGVLAPYVYLLGPLTVKYVQFINGKQFDSQTTTPAR
jgi:hypothetical protein